MNRILDGNQAVAEGVVLSRVQVIAAYPITPQTVIVEELSKKCASGELEAKFIHSESEHSAMASCIGASNAGVRAFTATSAQGLALMHELLHWAAGARLPIVLANINRSMAPPWTIFTDQSDSLSQRDTGWMQVYCEDNQEVLDSVILGFRAAEQVLLPVMLVLDAFVLSHTAEPVDIPKPELVDSFLKPYKPSYWLDPASPHAFGGMMAQDCFMESRYNLHNSMEIAKEVMNSDMKEFQKIFGRSHPPVDPYRLEDAELVLVTSGTVSGTARTVVDKYRERGIKVGLLKVRMFRPFPFYEVRDMLGGIFKVAVIDRNISYGHGGIFAQEIRASLHGMERPYIYSFIAGLGGRDITPISIEKVVEKTMSMDKLNLDPIWVETRIPEGDNFISI